uniref:Uncharacterized protein n=1 Tax=Lactuca sativa TaxID=4236 RepID=A0A9R1WRI0_LACSA|nr:hypothetical protein LSAT_V11C100037020 [Lactuca sativa]
MPLDSVSLSLSLSLSLSSIVATKINHLVFLNATTTPTHLATISVSNSGLPFQPTGFLICVVLFWVFLNNMLQRSSPPPLTSN